MPLCEYKCLNCGGIQEILLPLFKDPDKGIFEMCQKCGNKKNWQRIPSVSNFQIKIGE